MADTTPVYPKGYVKHFNRKSCETCIFFKYDINKPPQERIMLCQKVEPNVEVYLDDVCDEFKEV